MRLSVVIPVYNGASSIEPLVDTILSELSDIVHEIILVNDGSPDNSEDICEELALKLSQVVFVSLRRNFGEHNAVMCGLNHVTGDAAVIIDDDFQNPPSEIRKLSNELSKGFDVVYSRYEVKQHSLFRNLGSQFNNYVASYLLRKPRNLYLSSFKIISKPVVDEIIKYRGPFPYIDGLLLRVTKNISTVLVDHHKRNEGTSNYTIKKLVSLYLNMFLNFSVLPLRFFTVFGLGIFCLGVLFSILVLIEKLRGGTLPLGYTSLLLMIMMFSGVQIVFMGLIGEYLGKAYLDQNGMPQWVIKKIITKK